MSQTRAPRKSLTRAMAVAGAVVLASAALAGCSGRSSGGNGQNFVSGEGGVQSYPRGDRKAAPDLTGKSLQGKQVDVSDYRGDVVVINVWGSWCGPCRAEAKHLRQVAEDTADKGVKFVGLNTRDPDPANALAFERTYKITYPSIYDPYGKLVARFKSIPPKGIPSTIILDRDGKVAARSLIALNADELHSALDPVIAEKA